MQTSGKFGLRAALLGSVSSLVVVAALGVASTSALAQDQEAPPVTAAVDDEDALEEVLVTGSRIRRDSFSSAAPLQTFDIDAARQIGITTIGELLQRATVANGQQINGTQNTNAGNSNASEPPPAGGVGSSNIALRALEPERTLILINGRRLGSAGVRGAPSQPDLNLLPLSLIDHVEVITEGASAVYGADAVAGVVNVILRDSFEGFQVSVDTEVPLASGGNSYQYSFITGASSERAKLVVSGEFFEQKPILVRQRRDCVESIVVDANGAKQPSFCSLGFFDNIVYEGDTVQPVDPATGQPLNSDWFFATPGSTDVGVPGFSSALAFPKPSGNGQDCRRNDQRCRALGPIGFFGGQYDRLRGDLVQPSTRFSLVSFGSYKPELFGGDEEFYFESYYFNRHATVVGAIEQIFPTVPGLIRQRDDSGNIVVDATGVPVLVDNPLNPFVGDATIVYTLDELNQDRKVELQQFRFVGGLRGDFTGGALGRNNWNYDLYFSYDRGTGFVSQPLLSETNLTLGTQTLVQNPDGSISCGVPINNDTFGFITQQKCVPIDFFNPSVFGGGPDGTGTLGSDAERDFLIGTRLNRTVVQQFIISGSFTGDLFETQGGTAGLALGGEFRRDSINSAADFLSSNVLNAAENPLAEGATVGSRDITSFFGEVNIPLARGLKNIEYLGVEGAVRYTNSENFGTRTTARGRVTYRPNSWMSFSSSIGTSFRAPNLREQFLAAQFQGISSSADPCGVPTDANDGGTFVPAQDNRTATTIANCILSGADPTVLGLVANTNVSVVISGNSQTLKAETSRTYTATFQASPPISDEFDFDFAVSFFDIRVRNNIRSLNAQTILTRCFEGPANLASPFCSRISRKTVGQIAFRFVDRIDASFVNVGLERSQGLDFNTRFHTALNNVFGIPMDFSWSNALTIQTVRTERIFNTDPFDNLRGDFGIPRRRLNSTFSLSHDRVEFLLNVRHISGTGANSDIRLTNDCDVLDDALNRVGPNQVHPVCDASGAWYEDVSVTYRLDTVTLSAGINNLINKKPPLVSTAAGSNRANRVTSSGYDQFGRTVFFSATASF